MLEKITPSRPWIVALALAPALALPSPSHAAEGDISVHLEPEKTRVAFALEATGHTVEGTFHLREGHFELLPGGKGSGRLVVDALKAETGNAKRDKTMHKKVLESEAHPTITFTVESWDGTLPEAGAGEIELHGRMTLLGKDHPVTLPVKVEVAGNAYTGSTGFEVPFVDWGLHDPSLLFLRVKKVVQVNVETAGTLSRSAGDPDVSTGSER